MELPNKSKIAGVIGDPISHSLSPKLHGYLLTKYHIDGAYLPFRIAKENLSEEVNKLIKSGLKGFNVTVPHKEAIFKLCDKLSKTALEIGAVNTVIIMNDGSLFGHNSDAEGFINNIKQNQPNFNFEKKTAVVLGAGGAARAIVYGLIKEKIGEIIITNRSLDKAQIIKKDFDKYTKISVVAWENRGEILKNCDLLINTTSLGMVGNEELEIDLSELKKSALVTDIVYKPLMTKLLIEAQKQGNPIVTGIGMLINQALVGFEAWFGVKPEIDETLIKNMIEVF